VLAKGSCVASLFGVDSDHRNSLQLDWSDALEVKTIGVSLRIADALVSNRSGCSSPFQ